MGLTEGRTKMGNKQQEWQVKQQEWVDKNPIKTWVFRSILVCAVVGLVLWLRSEPESASKPDLNVKSETIAKQKLTPNQTILLETAENLLKWDEAAQDNFIMLFGTENFNNMNITMSMRKPKLESLKPCLMKPENEKALMKDIVIVKCITGYWNK